MTLCNLSLNLSSESQWHCAITVSTCHQNHNDIVQSQSQLVIRITMTLCNLSLNLSLESQWHCAIAVSTCHQNHNDIVQSQSQLVTRTTMTLCNHSLNLSPEPQWHCAIAVSTCHQSHNDIVQSQSQLVTRTTMTLCNLSLNLYLSSCIFTSFSLFLHQFLFLLGQVLNPHKQPLELMKSSYTPIHSVQQCAANFTHNMLWYIQGGPKTWPGLEGQSRSKQETRTKLNIKWTV